MVRKFHQIKIATSLAPTKPGGEPNITIQGENSFSTLRYNDSIGSSVTVQLPSPIALPEDPNEEWYIGLFSAKVYNTWMNVTAELGNNILKYQVGVNPWETITLPDGNYNLDSLNAAIQANIQTNGDGTPSDPGVTLSANIVNGTTIIQLNSDFKFDVTNTGLAALLGFNPQIIDGSVSQYHEGEHTANLNGGVDAVEVHVMEADGANSNGNTSKMIFSWTLEGAPWSLQDIWSQNQIMWFPLLTRDWMNSITVSLFTNTGLKWTPHGTNWEVVLYLARK